MVDSNLSVCTVGQGSPLHAWLASVNWIACACCLNTCYPYVVGKLYQYHGCWWPGCWHHQSIGGHDVDHVMWGCPFPPWQWMATTYNVSVSKNDIKCKFLVIYFIQTFQHIQCPVMTTLSLNVRLCRLILADKSEFLSVFADIKF